MVWSERRAWDQLTVMQGAELKVGDRIKLTPKRKGGDIWGGPERSGSIFQVQQ